MRKYVRKKCTRLQQYCNLYNQCNFTFLENLIIRIGRKRGMRAGWPSPNIENVASALKNVTFIKKKHEKNL